MYAHTQVRKGYVFFIILILLSLPACGTLEIDIETTATNAGVDRELPTPTDTLDRSAEATENAGLTTPSAVDATPSPTEPGTPTPSANMDIWDTYSNPVFGISLEYPGDWQPVSGYGGPETGDVRFAAVNGFFHISAMDGDTIDGIAAGEAEHHLQPYGSQPIIENLQVQGQEARLISPSDDQPPGMGYQAALIVRYPQAINISGTVYRYFVLWADQPHIRTIAQTLRFSTDPGASATDTPSAPIVWENLPPGLVYSAADGLWLVNSDEQPVLVHNNAQAVLSPDGTRLLSYDALERDLWLINRTEGAIWKLTQRPDRLECCFQWWPERPDVVLFYSSAADAERGPGLMGYLSAIGIDGQGYQILDPERDAGPGGFAPSPDGWRIAYGGGNAGWLYRWDAGPEPFNPMDYGLAGYSDVQIAQPSWSPDGTRLAWIIKGDLVGDGGSYAGVGLFDLETHTVHVLHPYEVQGVGWPSAAVWSPDGEWLAFTDGSPSEEAGLWVARADGRGEEYHMGLGGSPIWSPDGQWLAFQGFQQNGLPAYMLASAESWEQSSLDLLVDRYGMLVDWIDPAGAQ